jgi:putative ABC transport system substrate-binding protein
MIARRSLLGLLAASSLCMPQVARAQQGKKLIRIGYLSVDPGPGHQDELFKGSLRELGWIDGKNVTFEHRWSATGVDRLPASADELAKLKVDVIVVWGTVAALAAKKATQSIPIVMVRVADPVATGLVQSLARPGGNVTGISGISPELTGKRLEMLKEIVPAIVRVAFLAHGGDPAHKLFIKEAQDASRILGLQIQPVVVTGADDIDKGFSALIRERAEALIVQPILVSMGLAPRIAQLALRNRLPTIAGGDVFADAGGLLSYGTDIGVRLRRAAAIVDRILHGAKPSDLPVEQATHFLMVINLKTAKALGLAIPSSILVRADRVIK